MNKWLERWLDGQTGRRIDGLIYRQIAINTRQTDRPMAINEVTWKQTGPAFYYTYQLQHQ